MLDPKDYTLEQWVKLWQEAHESDSEDTYTYLDYLEKFAPKAPFPIPDPAPFPFNPHNPFREFWRKGMTDTTPTITTDHTQYTGAKHNGATRFQPTDATYSHRDCAGAGLALVPFNIPRNTE